MTICPIALAVGCEKCPAFKFCPLTTFLGDQQEEDKVDASPMTLAHDRDWSDQEKGGNATSPNIEHKEESKEDKYQKYAEEELEKNKKEEPKWGDSG